MSTRLNKNIQQKTTNIQSTYNYIIIKKVKFRK